MKAVGKDAFRKILKIKTSVMDVIKKTLLLNGATF